MSKTRNLVYKLAFYCSASNVGALHASLNDLSLMCGAVKRWKLNFLRHSANLAPWVHAPGVHCNEMLMGSAVVIYQLTLCWNLH